MDKNNGDQIWVVMPSTIFIYSNSKFKVTCKNADFECRNITTHTEENPSKIFNITSAILSKLPPWVLWSLLFLMKPSDVLQNDSFLTERTQSSVRQKNGQTLELHVELEYP